MAAGRHPGLDGVVKVARGGVSCVHSDFAGKGAEGERQLDAKPYGVEGGMQAASEKLALQRKPEPAARARGACGTMAYLFIQRQESALISRRYGVPGFFILLLY